MNDIIFHGHDKNTFRLALVGYVIICAASSGFYQDRFWGSAIPPLFWIAIALIGGIFLIVKDLLFCKRKLKLLIWRDVSFVVPVVSIPLLPLRHDFALILMLVFGIAYLLLYIYGFYQVKR